MLIITRKETEEITIVDNNNNIIGIISVMDIRGNKTRIGLNFKDDLKIYRNELLIAPSVNNKVNIKDA